MEFGTPFQHLKKKLISLSIKVENFVWNQIQMKCLEIARLRDFVQNTLGLLHQLLRIFKGPPPPP